MFLIVDVVCLTTPCFDHLTDFRIQNTKYKIPALQVLPFFLHILVVGRDSAKVKKTGVFVCLPRTI